jgi:Kef-type K+ transport system membrane component KefB
MKKGRDLIFYVLVIGGFGWFMYYIIGAGKSLEITKNIQGAVVEGGSMWTQFLETNHQNLTHPMAILLLQIITIIIVARIVGLLFKLIGQPMVIGEIAAGIILGPSLVGLYFPEFSGFLFPAKSLGNLQFLSQIGLILFMFIVGMELDLKVLRNKAYDAVIISHASIIIPFTLGVGLSFFLYTDLAPEPISFLAFSLFMGIAMSITAFPVLARIVQERGMTKTRIGSLAITCAAADDITAWSILAAVIAIVKAGSFVNSIFTIGMALIYIIIMLKLVKPFLRKIGEIHSSKENLSKHIVALFFITLFLSAVTTEVIGIHALFGAFMAGVIMPDNAKFRSIFIEKLEDVALVLFLPLFFVYTGLRTQIGLLNDPALWKDFGLILLVAVGGKFFGSAFAAKFVGQNWKDSLSIGALMNTRGLMELVVLNIAYDLGVLSPEIFAMLVLMALVTTFMTGPALAFINYVFREKELAALPSRTQGEEKYNILLSFGNPVRGRTMLRLDYSFIRKSKNDNSITSLHLTPIDNLLHDKLAESEYESFQPIKEEAEGLSLKINLIFKPSKNINKDIVDIANQGNYNLLIIGIGQSVFEGSIIGKVLGLTTRILYPKKLMDTLTGKEHLFKETLFDDRTEEIIKSCTVPMGIFIDKDLKKVEKALLLIYSSADFFLLNYAQKLVQHNQAGITVYDMSKHSGNVKGLMETVQGLGQEVEKNITIVDHRGFDKSIEADLVMISIRGWKEIVETRNEVITGTSSVIIMKN